MSKRHLTIPLKIAISAALIWLIFHKVAPDWKKSGERMMDAFQSGYGWLIAAVGLMGMVFTVSSLRWKTILRSHDVIVPFLRAVRLFLMGFFFGQFMPGGLAAGDIVRSYYVARCTTEKKMECVATVFVDRATGSLGLMTLVVVSLLLWGKHLTSGLLVIGAGAAVGIGIVLFFSKRILTRLPFATWIYERLPYRERLTRAYEAFRHYRKYKLQLLACWGLSVSIQLLLVLVAYCVGQSVGVQAPALQYLIGIPLVGAISSLPISFGNIGTAEAAYFLFFLGKDQPEAYRSIVLAFALMMRLLWLFVAGVGGLSWLAERGTISRKALQEQREVLEGASRQNAPMSVRNTGERE